MDELSAQALLTDLQAVDAQRAQRASDPALDARVQALKRYQQRRFEKTYADLLCSTRYAGATRFFLEELYGPADFSQRDAQFARVIPTLTRLFPDEIVATVAQLTRLHALSERLDTCMGSRLTSPAVDSATYVQAWRRCGSPSERQQQLELTLEVGSALDRLTTRPLLRQTLRLMRGPAKAAGLSALQSFLETGFDTFRSMHGAGEFLETVRTREQQLAASWFEGTGLGQLP